MITLHFIKDKNQINLSCKTSKFKNSKTSRSKNMTKNMWIINKWTSLKKIHNLILMIKLLRVMDYEAAISFQQLQSFFRFYHNLLFQVWLIMIMNLEINKLSSKLLNCKWNWTNSNLNKIYQALHLYLSKWPNKILSKTLVLYRKWT